MERRTAMTLSPRRDFFRKLALFGGLAVFGSSTRGKAQTASNIATQDITCDNGMPAFLAYNVLRGYIARGLGFPAGGRAENGKSAEEGEFPEKITPWGKCHCSPPLHCSAVTLG